MELCVCRICGGNILPSDFDGFGVCDHCGTMQSVPKQNDQNKIRLYTEATNLMLRHDYNNAIQRFLRILKIDSTDPDIYWSIALCRYGIEYVTDPVTNEKKPTLNRLHSNSFFIDDDYQRAIQYSNAEQKDYYASCAVLIENARSKAIEVIKFEEPYDVFICYKETDNRTGKRSIDSVLAHKIYDSLNEKGLRVFFSRISLEDKAGTAYEPYIFAALNSAKVMLVVTTSLEHVNAVWVQNEWSRYRVLIDQGDDKHLIPVYRGINPGDLPSEIHSYQGIDMNQPEYLLALENEILKHFPEKKLTNHRYSTNHRANNLLEIAFEHLEMEYWEDAQQKALKVLDIEAMNSYAFLALLMAECHISNQSHLGRIPIVISNSHYFSDIIDFGNDEVKDLITAAQKLVDDTYQHAVDLFNSDNKGCYSEAKKLFDQILTYENSNELAEQCVQLEKKQASYFEGLNYYSSIDLPNSFKLHRKYKCITNNCYTSLNKAIEPLKESGNYRDAEKLLNRAKCEITKYEIIHRTCDLSSANMDDIIQLLNSTGEDNSYIISKAKRLRNEQTTSKSHTSYREPLRERHPVIFWFLMLALAEVVIGIIVLSFR